MTSAQSLQVQLTGTLPFAVLLAVILAFPVSALLLRLYRRSVIKGMAVRIGPADLSRQAEPKRCAPPAPLQIVLLSAQSALPAPDTEPPGYLLARYGLWRIALAYAIGGAAYAAVMTAAWLTATHDDNLVWVKLLVLFWTYYWPAVLTALMVAGYDLRRRLQLFGAYFVVLFALMSVAISRNPDLKLVELPLHWMITNGPASVLLLLILARPIRAVGPLVTLFLIVAAIGSQSLLVIASVNESILRAIAAIGFSIGLGGTETFIAMIAVGMLMFAALGWPLLLWLGHLYEEKRFGDQSLTVDAIWLLFGLIDSIGLVFEGSAWIVSGLVAFVAFRLVTSGMMGLLSARGGAEAPKTLLLLRVFALGKRSERLFDKLRKHWQSLGSIMMIAGPDLATAAVEPHEFLEFVSGHQSRRFITGRNVLFERIRDADWDPDPDGRYRVNEFFCQSDTWQMTMEQLAKRTDAVLMDLRSFTPANQGCIFELGRLVDGVDLARVLFVIDATSDEAFLRETLWFLWHNMASNSPNAAVASPQARVLRITSQSEHELDVLLRLLLDVRASSA